MNKEDYFTKSKDLKLKSLSCPCLENCSRYKITAYLIGSMYSEYYKRRTELEIVDMGIVSHPDEIKNGLLIGPGVELSGNKNCFYFSNCCPEFNLFGNEHKPTCIPDGAISSGSFDKERKTQSKFKVNEFKHYSECSEYAQYIVKLNRSKGKLRKAIPPKTKSKLQQEINSECPFCASLEVSYFEVHHIDNNPANNGMENLLMLCSTCHSKITKGETKLDEVRKMKDTLALIQSHSLEFIGLKVLEKECMWYAKDKKCFFINPDLDRQTINPIFRLEFLNNSLNAIVIKSISNVTHYLNSGLSGLPQAYELKPTVKYTIELGKHNQRTEIELNYPLVVPPKQAASIDIELCLIDLDGKFKLITNRCIVNITLISNIGKLRVPEILLNTTNKNERLEISMLS